MKLERMAVIVVVVIAAIFSKGLFMELPFEIGDVVSPQPGSTVRAFFCPHCGGDPAHPCPIQFFLQEGETAQIEIGGDLKTAFATGFFESCCDCRITQGTIAGWADCSKLVRANQ